jgi:hypothetical protein
MFPEIADQRVAVGELERVIDLLVDPAVPASLGDFERFHHVGDPVEAPRCDGLKLDGDELVVTVRNGAFAAGVGHQPMRHAVAPREDEAEHQPPSRAKTTNICCSCFDRVATTGPTRSSAPPLCTVRLRREMWHHATLIRRGSKGTVNAS